METYNDNLNVAIIGLVRGYPNNKSKYEDLLLRNSKIYENVNSKLNIPYKMIIFHEGNISEDHQKYIQEKSQENLNFIDVSKIFNQYKNIDGYKIMCKFHMYFLWDYVSEYDYVIRIDEDIFIEKFDKNIIQKMNNKNIEFCYSKLSYESHTPTNNTLPIFIKEMYELKEKNFYNHLFPYTNFYISKTSIWKQKNIENILKKIATSTDQEKYRWGDLPVLGSLINIEKFNTKRMQGLTYYHSSHNILVINKFYSYILEYFHIKRFMNMYPNFFKSIKKIAKILLLKKLS